MPADPRTADGAAPSKLALATRYLALTLSVVFVAVGIAGFAVTGFDDVAGHSGDTLLGFGVNPLHNLIHLALGVVGLVLWRTTMHALVYGYVVLVSYFGALLYGVAALGQSWDVLSINTADNVLHAVLAAAGAFVVGLGHAALADAAPVDRRTWFRSARRGGHGAHA